MKSLFAMALLLSASAQASTLHCIASGDFHGIYSVDAVSRLSRAGLTPTVTSTVKTKNSDGDIEALEEFTSFADFDSSFQVAPQYEWSPFGIKVVKLETRFSAKGVTYALVEKTMCNIATQEESCADGEEIGTGESEEVKCLLTE